MRMNITRNWWEKIIFLKKTWMQWKTNWPCCSKVSLEKSIIKWNSPSHQLFVSTFHRLSNKFSHKMESSSIRLTLKTYAINTARSSVSLATGKISYLRNALTIWNRSWEKQGQNNSSKTSSRYPLWIWVCSACRTLKT